MRLTIALLFKKMPNGHIWRGKHRLYKKVTPLIAANLRSALEVEERNMFFLRNPYLTREQELGHSKALGIGAAIRRAQINTSKLKFPEHITLQDRFCHLKHNIPWD